MGANVEGMVGNMQDKMLTMEQVEGSMTDIANMSIDDADVAVRMAGELTAVFVQWMWHGIGIGNIGGVRKMARLVARAHQVAVGELSLSAKTGGG